MLLPSASTGGNVPDRPPRVAYVLLRDPAYSETFIRAEIEAVRSAGAQVAVFLARAGHESQGTAARRALRALTGNPVQLSARARRFGTGYGARGLLAATYAAALLEQVRGYAPDVVHTHFVNLPTAVAVLVAEGLGVPVTALAHAADFLLDTNPGVLDRRVRALSHLFVISGVAAVQLREQGVDLSRVPHSVVRAAFDGAVVDRPDRGPEGPPRLVTIARLIEKKGVDTAVEAVRRACAGGLDLRYDVFGDGPELARLRLQVTRSGLAGRVRLHGATPHAEAMAALAAADLAVLPCRRAANGDLDGIPVFLMEAASRGVPVVTTAVSGIPELVDGTRGWLTSPDDPVALAAAIVGALGDRAESRRRSAALRERIRTEFSPALQAERLLATWRRLGTTTDDVRASGRR